MRFQLLGTVSAFIDGEELVPHGVRRKALLALLALDCGRVVTTERLAEALWNGHPPPGSANTLKSHVSLLRRDLRRVDGLLQNRSSGYVLCADPQSVDSFEFERLAATGHVAARRSDHAGAVADLTAALTLFRGRPLADLAGLDFAVRESDRLDQLRLTVEESLCENELALGGHAPVIGKLQAIVADDPLRERSVGLLMLALYRAGLQAEALAVYRRTRACLVEDLGLDPTEDLQALEQRILAHDPTLAAHPQVTARSPATSRPPTGQAGPAPGWLRAVTRRGPCLGRTRERADVADVWAAVQEGCAALVVISGPPGVGKSRLAADIAAEAHAQGGLALHGRCDEEGTTPCQPFLEAVDRLSVGSGGIVGQQPSAGTTAGGNAERAVMFGNVVRTLAEAAASRPTVLILDDLHWADGATLQLLGHIFRHFPPHPLLVLATVRSGPLDPPVAAVLTALEKDGSAHSVDLAALDETASRQLITAAVGEPAVDHRVEDAVVALGRGNPFLLHQLADQAQRDPDALLRLIMHSQASHRPPELPDPILRVVALGFGDVSDVTRDALAVAAAIGARFDTATLFAVLGDDAFTAVDEALAARLIEPNAPDDGAFRFAHALLRDVAYARLSTGDRQGAHRRIASALEPRAAADPGRWAADRARHLIAALPQVPVGDAVATAHAAGEAAFAVLGFEQAAGWFERAIALDDSWGSQDRRLSCDLWLALGRARMAAGLWAAAKEAFARAARMARDLSDPRRLAEAALGYRGDYQGTAGLDPLLEHLLLDALSQLPSEEPGLRARLLAQLAINRYNASAADVRGLAREALDLARAGNDPVTLLAALHARHTSLWHPETAGQRLGLADEMVRVGVEAGIASGTQVGRWNKLLDHLDLGQMPAALDALHHYRRHAALTGRVVDEWWGALIAAAIAIAQGRVVKGEVLATEALTRGSALCPDDAAIFFAFQLFALRWAQGRLDELLPSIDELARRDPPLPGLDAGRSVALVATGRREEAAEVVRCAMHEDAVASIRQDRTWLGTLTLLAYSASECHLERACAQLLELMEPAAGLHVVMGPGFALLGPVSLWLGRLAHVVGDERAEIWRAEGIDQAARSGTSSWADLVATPVS